MPAYEQHEHTNLSIDVVIDGVAKRIERVAGRVETIVTKMGPAHQPVTDAPGARGDTEQSVANPLRNWRWE